ncbi:MAG: MurR/RpiR family transcriptional regulator [Magnetospiraceae bacterium]
MNEESGYQSIYRRLAVAASKMSPQLQRAAQFILENPDFVGLNSMRRVAAAAGVQPATVQRMIRAAGFEGYGEFSEPFRNRLLGRDSDYAGRARHLQSKGKIRPADALISETILTDQDSIGVVFQENDAEVFQKFCQVIEDAEKLYVLGLRSSYPIAFAFANAYRMFRENGVLLDCAGATWADDLRRVKPTDALLAIGFSPYTDQTRQGIAYARNAGARVLVVTDSVLSPLLGAGDVMLRVPDDSPTVFQSFVAPLAVIQALITMLVARGGEAALQAISESQDQLGDFDTYTTNHVPQSRKRRVGA